MKRKTIDTMREFRLWTSNIVVPTILIGVALYSNPDFRYGITKKFNEFKCKVHNKMNGLKRKGVD